MGALNNKNKTFLKKAGIFLQTLKNDHIDSSQIREIRKNDAIYEQLLWLISKVTGPAYALLFICDVTKRTVEKLNSFQNAVFVKCITRYYDSLSTRALKKKVYEFGLCNKYESLLL